jgi:hypothetical protein
MKSLRRRRGEEKEQVSGLAHGNLKKDFYRCLCPFDGKRHNLDLGIEELRGVLLILIRADKHK